MPTSLSGVSQQGAGGQQTSRAGGRSRAADRGGSAAGGHAAGMKRSLSSTEVTRQFFVWMCLVGGYNERQGGAWVGGWGGGRKVKP